MEDFYLYLFASLAALLYACYYNLFIVKRPNIIGGNVKLLQLLKEHCPISGEKYWPTWWCVEARMQTIMRSLLQSSPHASFENEYVRLPDGGEVKLDWFHNDEHSTQPRSTRPTIIFMPGLTGSSDENYMRHLVHEAWEMGCRCVVFNQRGTWGKPVKTPKLFCIANTEDTEYIIPYIKRKNPNAPLYGMGISAGGVLMCNYLAKVKDAAEIEAAFIGSAPFDFRVSTPVMETSLNYWLLNKAMTRYLSNVICKNLTMFQQGMEIDEQAIKQAKSIRELDELFTTKMWGYNSAFDYYGDAALTHKIKDIKRPVLILVSEDDPFGPECSIPYNEVNQSTSNVVVVATSYGGHIGFMEGTFPRHRGYMYRWFRQFIGAHLEHNC